MHTYLHVATIGGEPAVCMEEILFVCNCITYSDASEIPGGARARVVMLNPERLELAKVGILHRKDVNGTRRKVVRVHAKHAALAMGLAANEGDVDVGICALPILQARLYCDVVGLHLVLHVELFGTCSGRGCPGGRGLLARDVRNNVRVCSLGLVLVLLVLLVVGGGGLLLDLLLGGDLLRV